MSLSLTGWHPAPARSVAGFGPGTVAFAMAVGSAVLAAVLWRPVVLTDPDTLWHITVGQWILEHRSVPSIDSFSLTAAGRPWVAHEWLSEVIMALVYRTAGWNGIMVLTAAAAGTVTAIVGFHLRRFLRVDVAMLIMLLAVACACCSLLARPHLFALPCLAIWTVALVSARARGAAPSLWLLPLMTLWANLHGGFVLGLALTGALGLEAVFDPACNRRVQIRQWGLFGLAAVLAAAVTPHGIDGLIFPFRLLAMKSLSQIQEWMPSEMGDLTGLTVAVLLAIYLGLTGRVALPKYRVFLLTGLLFSAMQHSRNGQVFAVVAPLLMADCLGRTAMATGDVVGSKRLLRIERIASLAVLLVALVSLSGRFVFGLDRLEDGYFAPAALEHVPAALRTRPVLNDYGFGGLLIFSGIRPFIDGRADLYGDEDLLAYSAIAGGRGNALDTALCRYDIAWTMFPPSGLVPELLDRTPGWHRLYSDKNVVIQVRDSEYRPVTCRDR